MKNTETLLIECLETVGNKISNCKYLTGLLKNGKKFEGWFQVEFAKVLNKKADDFRANEVLVEHKTDRGFYVDVCIRQENENDIAVEIKFIVKSRAITKSRESLLDQIKNNSESHQSFGVAVLVAPDEKSWFNDELERINTRGNHNKPPQKIDLADNENKLFCIYLLICN
jgi:hypothetical protein